MREGGAGSDSERALKRGPSGPMVRRDGGRAARLQCTQGVDAARREAGAGSGSLAPAHRSGTARDPAGDTPTGGRSPVGERVDDEGVGPPCCFLGARAARQLSLCGRVCQAGITTRPVRQTTRAPWEIISPPRLPPPFCPTGAPLLHEWRLSACALPRQCCNDGVTKRIVSRDDPSGHQERCLAAALPRGHTLSLP